MTTIKKGRGSVTAKYSSLLVEQSIRESHKLNFKSGALAGHHLISNSVVKNLSETRKLQLVRKGWSINHGYNVVLLPAIPSIACQYDMPCHETGTFHTEPVLFSDFYSNKSVKNRSNLKARKSINSDDEDTIKKTYGYHKAVATELAVAIKGMTCDTDYITDVDNIDELSIKLSDWISEFELLLTPDGRRYSEKHSPNGCGSCKITPKEHFKIGNSVNKPLRVKETIEPNSSLGYSLDAETGDEYVITDKKNNGKLQKYKLEKKIIPSKDTIESLYRAGNRIMTVQELKEKL